MSSSSSSSSQLSRSSGSTTPAKKAPFRPASAHPSSSSTASSPAASHITPPKTRIPTFTRSPASSSSPPSPPSSASPAAAGSMPSPHSGPAIMRAAPGALAKKNLSSSPAASTRLSGEINAARNYLASESSLSSASAMVSQADRRNRLKKRLLIAQTEKIKELLWEKASLLQKRQLMEDEQRETEQLKQKIEEEREERQRQWVMEEAQRREEEEEELKFSLMRLRKFSQRYDFEMAKRERMIRSKEQKEKKKSNFAAEMQAESRRKEAERSRVIEGIREQLDDTLQPGHAALTTATATTASSGHSPAPAAAAAAPAPLAVSAARAPSSPPTVTSPTSPASSNSSVLPAFVARRTSDGAQSTTSNISESEVARELRAGGFPAGRDRSSEAATTPTAAAPPGGAPTGAKTAGSADNSAGDDLLDFREDGIAHADGLLDDDDVLFLSSTDSSDEEEEKEVSQSGSRRSSVNAVKAAKKASAKAAREEKEQEREREEMEKRQQETAKEREEREKREEEERQRKEKEWEELKERLMNETRQLQETERLRLQREREEENKRAALQLAAREAEMNELIAKLKEQEGKGGALPAAAPAESAPAAAAPAAAAPALPESSAPPRAATSPAQPASTSTTPTQSLPPLSSISLRSATASVSRRLKTEDEIDEPKQAPGAVNPLPSLSSTPVRRLVSPAASPASSVPASGGRGRKPEQSESMAISSMLHELEALEEEEEMMLKMGLDVTKLPRSGKPKVVRMFIDKSEQDDWLLRWDSKKKSRDEASIPLSQCRVVTGIGQGLFLKPDFAALFAARRNCCFSVICPDRTLDVCCTTHSDQDVWTRTLSRLAKARKRGGGGGGTAGGSAAGSEANSRLASPPGSAPASRRASGTAAGFVSVGTERSRSGKVGGASGLSEGDPNKDIENYLSRHLKNF